LPHEHDPAALKVHGRDASLLRRRPAAARAAVAEVLHAESGAVRGVAAGNLGLGKDGQPHAGFWLGMDLIGKYGVFAETKRSKNNGRRQRLFADGTHRSEPCSG